MIAPAFADCVELIARVEGSLPVRPIKSSSSAMAKTIYLVRHAQAEHNVAEDWSIADAPLTPLGRQQARDLNEATASGLQKEVQLVVTSPLRRTMATTLDGFPEAIERLGGRSNIILLPEAQECNDCKSLRADSE